MSVSEKIAKAFNNETSNSGLVHLNTAQADAFIDYIKDESIVLKNARVKKMNAPMESIAKLGVGEDIFHPATRGQRLDDAKRVQVGGDEIKLVTKEIMAEVKILDDELEDNIEGSSFKEHLMKMLSKKGANQLERAALYARQNADGDTINSLFDGYIKDLEAKGNVIDASKEEDRFVNKEKLARAYKAIPTKYRSGLNKFYMPNDLGIDYENLYERTANDVNRKGAYGIEFSNVPLMSIERPVKVDGGFEAILTVDWVKGENTVTLSKTTGLKVGDDITLAIAGDKEFTTRVTDIDSTSKVVTLEEGLAFNYSSSIDAEKVFNVVTRDGSDIILTENSNFIWGVQRDISIETERSARERATYFVMTMRCDFAVENPKAAALIKNLKVK